ncbi:flagellar export chaperone FliS [Sphingomonas changnyeongensis]|uniref:Flagellar secretion chaperone FliS n=1 Tax=Sphingomonas changnyeongensis TaxID=2698679 RepID=A0A7Z2S4K7_9SPHN|nr:flagellar export chaperone FliS [Sphingomonas changnyeongensis]QHL90180.1 flagellar export chaperone FliS [Sphingomonas changnyeongensis]
MSYASRLARDPIETYRQVDLASRVGGADRHQLVGLLYDEALMCLRLAERAIAMRDYAAKSARITKALALLFALEAGLDFTRGGEVAQTLSRFYRGARAEIMQASVDNDAALLRATAGAIGEIAASWRAIAGAG